MEVADYRMTARGCETCLLDTVGTVGTVKALMGNSERV